MPARLKTWISGLLMLGGAFLVYLGARDFLASRTGQKEAAREFTIPPPPAVDALPAPARLPKRGETVARLVIPRLDAELYVVEGDGPRELRRGPGHLTGSAMPGETGNCVIAGHRDTHFRVLKDIREGDDILLETPQATFIHQVRKTAIVSPKNRDALRPTAGPYLNLITCYPFYYVGPAPKRFVVEAMLAATTPPSDSAITQ
jgi:sortase A